MDKRLLEVGWAGELTLEEARFIQSKLLPNSTLRRQWGFRGKGKVPLVRIAERALPEAPKYAREHMRKLQAQEAGRRTRQITPQLKNKVFA